MTCPPTGWGAVTPDHAAVRAVVPNSGGQPPPVSVTVEREARDTVLMSTEAVMPQPQTQAQLSVRNGRAAVDFYKAAFGAVEVFRFGGTDDLEEVVAQLAIGTSLFWVEDESPAHGNFSPETVGGATVRMLLIVDDPGSVLARAVAEGATPISPLDDEHGWRLGRIDDPFGHRWEIGKPISDWPPAQDPSIAR
jgi:PhnB protein